MSYDVTLVEVQATSFAFQTANTDMGFGVLPFNYLLFNMWTCLPADGASVSDGGPGYIFFFEMGVQGSFTTIKLYNQSTFAPFFDGVFDNPNSNIRSNHLVSVDCTTKTVQYYVNDVAVPLTSGGWIGSNHFQVASIGNIWDFDVGSTLGIFPAFADLWCAAPISFFDLTVTANRRKFINADLTPVDLGTNGQIPLGTDPQIFQTIPTSGVPNDFLTNQGLGADFALHMGAVLAFQTPGTCNLPPAPPVTTNLSMDNVVVQCLTTESPCTARLFPSSPSLGLRWSDTRGLTWGNPVPQDFSTNPYWQPQWNRTGYARDRVFELFWTVAYKTAVNGAFVEVFPLKT